jgi:nucleoside-diphosphate-sugar epimerase
VKHSVLLTGASGFIGRALTGALAAAGVPCEAARVDIRDHAPLTVRADTVIHLAAHTATAGSWHTNVFGTARVAEWAMQLGWRLIFASTLTVARPRDPYDREKALGEQLLQANPALRVVILRLGHVYGPGALTARSSLNHVLRVAAQGTAPRLFGNALAQRDSIYIDDVVTAFVAALDAPPGIYDVGTGTGLTLAHTAMLVAKAAGTGWATSGELSLPADLPAADPARFLPGWQPQVPLGDGIERTLAWYRQQAQQVQEKGAAGAPERHTLTPAAGVGVAGGA